jgi:hypothetical protein
MWNAGRRASAMLIGAALLAGLLGQPPGARSQPRPSAADEEPERAFVEALRREDPESAERYVSLRDARAQAMADLQRLQGQYHAAGAELRFMFIGQLRQAQRKYAERSLALLDFLDARDRRALARYQEEIGRINGLVEERARARAEFEKMVRGD